jgi:hypothetical protein
VSDKVYRIKTDWEWVSTSKDCGPDKAPDVSLRSDRPFATLRVYQSGASSVWWIEGKTTAVRCDDLEHGKQLSQAWYEERMAAGLEEVPCYPPAVRYCTRPQIIDWRA